MSDNASNVTVDEGSANRTLSDTTNKPYFHAPRSHVRALHDKASAIDQIGKKPSAPKEGPKIATYKARGNKAAAALHTDMRKKRAIEALHTAEEEYFERNKGSFRQGWDSLHNYFVWQLTESSTSLDHIACDEHIPNPVLVKEHAHGWSRQE